MDMYNENMVPVFLVKGFLESGKTNFLKDTITADYFQLDQGYTILFITEEGEEEYDDDELAWNRTIPVIVDDIEDLTPEFMLQKLQEQKAVRVIIEWNGMWDPKQLRLPEGWMVYQELMMVDANTFPTYYQNGDMRSILSRLALGAEVIICNRCDEKTMDLPRMKQELMGLNSQAEIVMEGPEGEINLPFADEELPYDVSGPIVEIAPENYGVFFMDAGEATERYAGKKVRYTGFVYKQRGLKKTQFVFGRMAMNGCVDPSCVDPSCQKVLLGYLCNYKNTYALKDNQWITVTATLKKEYVEAYGEEGPVIYVESVEPAKPIEEYVTFS